MKGIGNDIIEIGRIRKTIDKHGAHFYNKIFTKKELDYCLSYKDPAFSLAGRFSVKESIAKAVGTGFGPHLSWLDIEILNDKNGKPYPQFSKSFNQTFNNPKILISISHSKLHATSVAIWVD